MPWCYQNSYRDWFVKNAFVLFAAIFESAPSAPKHLNRKLTCCEAMDHERIFLSCRNIMRLDCDGVLKK